MKGLDEIYLDDLMELKDYTPPVLMYSITPDYTSRNEGQTVSFAVETVNVPDGTLYYTLQGTLTSGDVEGGSLTGSVLIAGGIGSFTKTFVEDLETEDTKEFTVKLRTGSISGQVVAESITVTLLDNEVILPPPTLCSIYQGGLVVSNNLLAELSDTAPPYSGSTWNWANNYVNNLVIQGIGGWRLPTEEEATSVFIGCLAHTGGILRLTSSAHPTVTSSYLATNVSGSSLGAVDTTSTYSTVRVRAVRTLQI